MSSNFIIVCVLLIASSVYSYPNGAPKTACSTLQPKHPGAQLSTSALPYQVGLKKLADKYEIIISGKEFQGLILQVRDGDKPVGQFVDLGSDYQAVGCEEGKTNTITQTSKSTKSNVKLTWVPTSDLAGKKLVLGGTILQDYSTYWTLPANNLILEA